MNARKQYLEEVGKEYQRADEKGRGRLLDEAETPKPCRRVNSIFLLAARCVNVWSEICVKADETRILYSFHAATRNPT
jgi:hypothetical protein